MQSMYYVGLDVHKRTIGYYVKNALAKFMRGYDSRHTFDLDRWMRTLSCNSELRLTS